MFDDLQEEYSGICPYCNRKIEVGHVDHIVPVVKGGRNNRSNLVWVCAECNLRKNDHSLLWFILYVRPGSPYFSAAIDEPSTNTTPVKPIESPKRRERDWTGVAQELLSKETWTPTDRAEYTAFHHHAAYSKEVTKEEDDLCSELEDYFWKLYPLKEVDKWGKFGF
jgi:hypothetical protein